MRQKIDEVLKNYNQLLGVLLAGCLFSCSVKSYIPDDELLYTGAEIKVSTQSDSVKLPRAIKDELEELLRPIPNATFLGMRLGLRSYYRAQRENPG